MRITFLTVTAGDKYDPWERHIILVDNKAMMSASEGIEPEDCRFYRDMMSPFECLPLINKVAQAAKDQQEIVVEYKKMTSDEYEEWEENHE